MEIDAIAEKLSFVLDVSERAGAKRETRTTLVMVAMSDRIDSLFVESPSFRSFMRLRMIIQ